MPRGGVSSSELNVDALASRTMAARPRPVRRAKSSKEQNGPTRRAATICSACFTDMPSSMLKPRRRCGAGRRSEPHHRSLADSGGARCARPTPHILALSSPLPSLPTCTPTLNIHVHRPDLDAVLPGVADQLGRGVEAHRLAVQQRGGEGGRVVVLQPGRHVDQQGEAGRVRLGKAVVAEAADLREHRLGILRRKAAGPHARRSACWRNCVDHARAGARRPSRGEAGRPRRA